MSDLPFMDDQVEFVDEDGEILFAPEGEDALSFVAQKALEATEQEKLWDARQRVLKGQLVHRQDEKRAVYGEASVLIQQSTKLDRVRLRALIEEAQLEDESIFELLYAATQFNVESLPEDLQKIVRRAQVKGASFAKVSRVRKLSPETP